MGAGLVPARSAVTKHGLAPQSNPESHYTSQICDRLAQRRERVARGDELLGEVALKPVSTIAFDDRRVVELLRLVDLVAARDAAGVVVGDVVACSRGSCG